MLTQANASDASLPTQTAASASEGGLLTQTVANASEGGLLTQAVWIDSNCMIGRQNAPHPFSPRTTEETKEHLLAAGVTTALVYHAYAKEYHPLDGNRQLMRDIAGDDFYKPVWVLLPGHTDEFPDAAELHELLCANKVAGTRCFPSVAVHNFSMSDWCMGTVYDVLERMRMPLYIDLDQTNWDTVDTLLSARPGLRLVLTNVGYRHARYFAPLIRKHRHLHLELSMYKNFMGIEKLVRDFGSERFVYGTGMPIYAAGPCRHMVETADIAPADKANIAFRNATRILEDIVYA